MRILKRTNSYLNDMSLSNKGIAVVSIPLALLLITLVITAWYGKQSRTSQEWISHSLKVKASLSDVRSLVTDSETAVRGYLLWRAPVYLKPYNEATVTIVEALEELRELVTDDNAKTSRALAIKQVALDKMDILGQVLNNPEIAKDMSGEIARRGRATMETFRRLIREMEQAEQMHLNTRIKIHDELVHKINITLISIFILALLVGITASYIVSSGILKRVNKLERYARRVSRGKPATWKDGGEDEVGQLGRSVEIMTTSLLSRENALELTQKDLEAANANLKSLLSETRAANQELESFSYSVSHDLRAPLRHISGFSELMLRNSDSLDGKNKRYLDIIASSINQMGVLIDELLAFSRMGRATLKMDRIELNEVINNVLHDLSPELNDREITWNVASLPAVRGDQVMIKLVLQNLLGNALKYTRKRPVATITVEAHHLPDEGMEAIIVKDNGVGFDMAYYDKLFGVFQRLHSSDDYEGTGIGLATVRRIVQRHGGQVSAEGAIDKGAIFTVTLPADKGA